MIPRATTDEDHGGDSVAIPVGGRPPSPEGDELPADQVIDRLADIHTRMAAATVRRAANRHGCIGAQCADPLHRRDVALATHLIAMLDLPTEYRPVTAQDRAFYRLHRGADAPDRRATGADPYSWYTQDMVLSNR